MALSVFEDPAKPPSKNDLKKALGASHALWSDIKKFLMKNYSAAKEEWKYSGKSYGWGFRLKG